ncbi:MAG: TraR/DksA family transcriptional regulator [Planctomycetota bacterium]
MGKKKGASKAGKASQKASQPKAKFVVSLAPKGFKRKVAPGVQIEEANPVAAPPPEPIRQPPPQEAHKLSARELRQVREALQKKRQAILAGIRNQIDDSLSRTSVMSTDTADRASDVYDGTVSYEMALTGSQYLQEIETALNKLDKKTYGQCELCGGEIGTSRLKLMPFATLCTNCRKQTETTEMAEGSEPIWGFLDNDAAENAQS